MLSPQLNYRIIHPIQSIPYLQTYSTQLLFTFKGLKLLSKPHNLIVYLLPNIKEGLFNLCIPIFNNLLNTLVDFMFLK